MPGDKMHFKTIDELMKEHPDVKSVGTVFLARRDPATSDTNGQPMGGITYSDLSYENIANRSRRIPDDIKDREIPHALRMSSSITGCADICIPASIDYTAPGSQS